MTCTYIPVRRHDNSAYKNVVLTIHSLYEQVLLKEFSDKVHMRYTVHDNYSYTINGNGYAHKPF